MDINKTRLCVVFSSDLFGVVKKKTTEKVSLVVVPHSNSVYECLNINLKMYMIYIFNYYFCFKRKNCVLLSCYIIMIYVVE